MQLTNQNSRMCVKIIASKMQMLREQMVKLHWSHEVISLSATIDRDRLHEVVGWGHTEASRVANLVPAGASSSSPSLLPAAVAGDAAADADGLQKGPGLFSDVPNAPAKL